MALAFGAISAVDTTQTPTSVAVSGSDTIGFVDVAGDIAADNISAVTWNGAPMTKIAAVQTSAGERWLSSWYIVNPASSATISFTGGSFWRSYSSYYTGAKQTGQVDSFNTGNSTASTAISVATTVVASNCWIRMFQKDGTGGATYSASGVLASMRANTDAGGLAIADSNATVGTGSQTGTLTAAGTSVHGAIIMSIAPAVAAGPTNLSSMNGVAKAAISSVNGVSLANITTINGVS